MQFWKITSFTICNFEKLQVLQYDLVKTNRSA